MNLATRPHLRKSGLQGLKPMPRNEGSFQIFSSKMRYESENQLCELFRSQLFMLFWGGGNSSSFCSQATFKEKQVIILQFVVHSLPFGRRCPQKLKFGTEISFCDIVNLRFFGNIKILFFLQKNNRKYLIEILIGINLRRDIFLAATRCTRALFDS